MRILYIHFTSWIYKCRVPVNNVGKCSFFTQQYGGLGIALALIGRLKELGDEFRVTIIRESGFRSMIKWTWPCLFIVTIVPISVFWFYFHYIKIPFNHWSIEKWKSQLFYEDYMTTLCTELPVNARVLCNAV